MTTRNNPLLASCPRAGALVSVMLLGGLVSSCAAEPRVTAPVKVMAASPTPAPLPQAAIPSQPYQWRNVAIIAGGFVDALLFHPMQEGLAYARTDIGGAYRWDKASARWVPLNDWAGGKDGNLLGCESIGMDPTDPKRLYLALGTYTQGWAGNGAIMRSSDGGRTWRRTDMAFKMGGNEDGRSAGERLMVDSHKNGVLYMGSRNDGLWKSADYGATWAKVESFPVTGRTNGVGVVFVVFDRASGAAGAPTPTIYVGVSQKNGPGLYRSADAGATWTAVAGQPQGLLPHHGEMDAQGALYLTYSSAPGPNDVGDGAVWKLDTKTNAWTDITPQKPNTGGAPGFGYAGLAVDARHPGVALVSTMDHWSGGDTLFRTTDGGAHWTDLGPKTKRDWSLTPYLTWGKPSASLGWWIGALALDPFHPGHVMYGTGATIWGSDDTDNSGVTHWSVRAAGLEETAVNDLVSPPVGAHLLSALGDIGGFRHDDFAVSPRSGMMSNPIFTTTSSIDYAASAPNIVARVGRVDGGAKRGAYSTDAGATWTPFASEPAGTRGSGSVAVSADGKTFVWASEGAAPAYSQDLGATWKTSAGLAADKVKVIADRVDSDTFYAMDDAHLFVSTDGGASFAPSAGSPPQGAAQLRAAPGRKGDLWVTAGNSGVYHSTDGGAGFAPVGRVPNAQKIGFGKAAPGRDYPAIYLTGETQEGASGVFRSDDAGKTWVRINDDAHQYGFSGQSVTGDPRVYGRVYMGSNGRGALYADPAPGK
ncbi:carbohydrate-binding protein [Capsulimonas corticalis]|uniref:Carbohydrate-binding protein n=1 Tax=Capsulimonas corticalis TaxID=2219043 RepID=A0A402D4R1_9BACT|nr:carbohydrate-binding protein [Capsulimonas corticalis]BDI29241.1 carbohydrate-binding protein [Capsulimonas corticalis]